LPGVDSKSFFAVSPARWHAGSMQLLSLTLGTGANLTPSSEELERRDDLGNFLELPKGVAVRAPLPSAASGTVTLRARFRVHVPERFGTFAWYRDELFLTGGWYPMVAPRDAAGRWDTGGALPRADADVDVDAPADRWIVLDGIPSAPAPGVERNRVSAAVRD